MKRFLVFASLFTAISSIALCDEPPAIPQIVNVPQFDVIAHDPVIVKEDATYYLFTTGPGVSVWTSEDMELWTMQESVFEVPPDWALRTVTGFNGHMWAPDLSFRNGTYYLYYSVSSFGKNDSCIGLATNRTLNRASQDFEWIDRGIVVQSRPGIDDWNAIDPNLVFDSAGQPYLAFGSFWSGLKIARLTSDLTRLLDPDSEPHSIANRVVKSSEPSGDAAVSLDAGNGAIEGAFIYRKGGYFYLFASVDYCCRGIDSTYKMIFGRAESLLGPYIDEDGISLLDGGGTLLKRGDERWHGVGHNSICEIDGVEYAVFHGYDGQTKRGLPKLHVQSIAWSEDNWPYLIK